MKLYLILELAAFFLGLATVRVARPAFIKVIVVLMAITIVNEFLFIPYVKAHKLFNRNIAYNIFSIAEMAGWFIFFYLVNTEKKLKHFILVLWLACLAYTLLELCIFKSWVELHPDSFRLFNTCMLWLSGYYFYCILKKDYHDLRVDPVFWICAGCFLFHLVFFVNITTIAETRYWKVKDARHIFNILQDVANTCYYSLLCTAFIVCFYKSRRKLQISYQDL